MSTSDLAELAAANRRIRELESELAIHQRATPLIEGEVQSGRIPIITPAIGLLTRSEVVSGLLVQTTAVNKRPMPEFEDQKTEYLFGVLPMRKVFSEQRFDSTSTKVGTSGGRLAQ